MVASLPVTLIVGTALGFLTGLGIGGGSLLILWLTMVLGMDPQTARGINLLFFLPAAAVSCFFRARQGKLELKRVLPAMIAGSAAAGICAVFSTTADVEVLKKGFGIILIAAGLRELLWKKK